VIGEVTTVVVAAPGARVGSERPCIAPRCGRTCWTQCSRAAPGRGGRATRCGRLHHRRGRGHGPATSCCLGSIERVRIGPTNEIQESVTKRAAIADLIADDTRDRPRGRPVSSRSAPELSGAPCFMPGGASHARSTRKGRVGGRIRRGPSVSKIRQTRVASRERDDRHGTTSRRAALTAVPPPRSSARGACTWERRKTAANRGHRTWCEKGKAAGPTRSSTISALPNDESHCLCSAVIAFAGGWPTRAGRVAVRRAVHRVHGEAPWYLGLRA